MSDRLVGEDFGRLFQTFEHTAWRLETRDSYLVEEEQDPYRSFLAGEPVGLDWFQPWLDQIAELTSSGKRIGRVRLVTTPLTDYLRFELHNTVHNQAAGEDIRFLDKATGMQLGLPDYDYWLFDSNRVGRMHFDSEGRPLGAEIITDPAIVVQHNYWRDRAIHHAIPFDEFRQTKAPRRAGQLEQQL